MSVLIIAEAGVNHNGNIDIAKSLVDAAIDAKADVVKFQTFSADKLVTLSAPKVAYQKDQNNINESQFAMLKKLELTQEMHQELFDYCEKRNIKFLSTGFDIQSIDLLVNLGQNFFKIASGEITNFPYLRHIGRLKKPVIISTGMSNLEEVAKAIDVLEQHGTPKDLITALHCTSAYPAPFSEINLRAMVTIKEELGVAIGYSDHTLGTEASIAAVAIGATVIEKHFTLDRNLPGPDHKASLEPSELTKMVSAIRNIEMALGDGIKRAMPSELENRQISRKSLVASKNITAGELFTELNIVAKRPGTGISPMKWDRILGISANRNYKVDEFIDNET